MNPLWHYTCTHGLQGIEWSRWRLRPNGLGDDLPKFVWLTDLEVPIRDALGLTSRILTCDRTEHRLQVQLDEAPAILPWRAVRRSVPSWYRIGLEEAPGAMPMHWFVATELVPVVAA